MEMTGHNLKHQMHVLDLPQLYRRPSADELMQTLSLLRVKPKSFEISDLDEHSSVAPEGIPNYLTSIISNDLGWIQDENHREQIWDFASLCLSERSGRSAQPAMTRTFEIIIEDGLSVPIEIHEPAYTSDNIGVKTWSSSYILAKNFHLIKVPVTQGTASTIQNSVLELGAGTGLVGIAASLVWKRSIYLTDMLSIEPNLTRNVALNREALAPYTPAPMYSGVLDWTCPSSLLLRQSDGSFRSLEKATFNTIVIADPIYSDEHPKLLADAVKTTLNRESSTTQVIVALPLREGYSQERRDLDDAFISIGLRIFDTRREIGYDDWGSEEDPLEVSYEIKFWTWSHH